VTGLIYVVIIALWAAVLIPMWLRRHDQISEVRSTARFSSAMKSLGSQGQVQYATDSYPLDSRSLEMSLPTRRTPDPEVRMSRPTSERPALGLDPDYERELVRQSAATRRAVVLGTLTLILLACLVLAIVGVLPRWAPMVAALPVVAFVLAASMTSSARSGAQSQRRQSGTPSTPRMAAPVATSAAQTDDDWETWNAWDDEDSWDAVPTTLPTYVTAPRASAVPRGIDRARPGEWTGEAMVETARAMRSRSATAGMDASDVDHGAQTAEIPVVRAPYDDRRAVNQ
jgi:hypothetical protein